MLVELDKARIDLLNLSPRVITTLHQAGYRNIFQLQGLTQGELAEIPHIGPAAVSEIVDALEHAGINVPKEQAEIDDGVSRARVRAIRPVTSRLVGQNIRRIRERRAMPRQMLVWELHKNGFNVSEAVLKNMELGMPGKTRRPRWITVDEALAFAKVLDVPVGELFEDAA